MATLAFLRQIAGVLTEVRTVETSAGAGDASKVPNTNSAGVLDLTIVNGKTTSAGSGDANKLPALDATGKLDTSFMPVGIGADTATITATESMSAGAFGNIYNVSGVVKVRNADAASGKTAHCFVLAAVSSGNPATVYFEGTNTQVSARTPGATQFLGAAGAATETAPTTAGQILQVLGVAILATAISFEEDSPITLA